VYIVVTNAFNDFSQIFLLSKIYFFYNSVGYIGIFMEVCFIRVGAYFTINSGFHRTFMDKSR